MEANPARLAGLIQDSKHPPLAGGEDDFLKGGPLQRLLVRVVVTGFKPVLAKCEALLRRP